MPFMSLGIMSEDIAQFQWEEGGLSHTTYKCLTALTPGDSQGEVKGGEGRSCFIRASSHRQCNGVYCIHNSSNWANIARKVKREQSNHSSSSSEISVLENLRAETRLLKRMSNSL